MKMREKAVDVMEKFLSFLFGADISHQAPIAFLGGMIMAYLRLLSETGKRSALSEFIEALTCGFLGVAFLLVMVGLGFHPYLGYAGGLVIGHLGAIRARRLAIDAFKRRS